MRLAAAAGHPVRRLQARLVAEESSRPARFRRQSSGAVRLREHHPAHQGPVPFARLQANQPRQQRRLLCQLGTRLSTSLSRAAGPCRLPCMLPLTGGTPLGMPSPQMPSRGGPSHHAKRRATGARFGPWPALDQRRRQR